MQQSAAAGRFPGGTDVFLYKYHGLFYVAPAQDAFMCRLRFAGGAVRSYQLRGLADLATRCAGGYADVTTRANLQLREIPADRPLEVLQELSELGIINRGAGADNIRNITASPTSGFDPQELLETLPLARQLHLAILQQRTLYGLPRKFNIGFDGGGQIRALEDTNDIGFRAVRVDPPENVDGAVMLQLLLGGITGHGDFARDTAILVQAEHSVAAALAIVRTYLEYGDRSDRKRARLKYLLDEWGVERFLTEAESRLPDGSRWQSLAANRIAPRPAELRWGHVGWHPQKQPGRWYLGLILPVGRLTAAQMRGLADITDRYAANDLRLTVWQNALLHGIRDADREAVQQRVEDLGLEWRHDAVRGGLVACTGSAGCKFAAADTKRHALELAEFLDGRVTLDQPVNIHLTGCSHSCAQHYIGDIGLLATGIDTGDDMVEGYHLYVGGGWDNRQALARELFRDVPAEQLSPLILRLLEAYQRNRLAPDELFCRFVRRHTIDELQRMVSPRDVHVADSRERVAG
jgi:ferredoxin-nitrite reductase